MGVHRGVPWSGGWGRIVQLGRVWTSNTTLAGGPRPPPPLSTVLAEVAGATAREFSGEGQLYIVLHPPWASCHLPSPCRLHRRLHLQLLFGHELPTMHSI